MDKDAQEILHYQLLIWADVELGLAIFCASAAALRPLLRQSSAMIWGTADAEDSHMQYEGPVDVSPSCDHSSAIEPLSTNEREPSNGPSSSSGPSGIQGYELSQMNLDLSLDQQKRCKYQIQSLKS